MITMPATVSPLPSRVTAPWRELRRRRRRRRRRGRSTGVPSVAVSTTRSMSAGAGEQPDAADVHLLPALDDVARAGVGVAALERLGDTSRSVRPYLTQPLGVDHDLVLLDLAAEAVDLGDPGHGAQPRARRASPGSSASPSARSPRPRWCTGRSRRARSTAAPARARRRRAARSRAPCSRSKTTWRAK